MTIDYNDLRKASTPNGIIGLLSSLGHEPVSDWDGLVDVIKGTGAEIVKVTHGKGDAISRFLSEKGMNVSELKDSSFQREEME